MVKNIICPFHVAKGLQGMNNVAMNIGVKYLFKFILFIFMCLYPEVKLLDYLSSMLTL